jgi:hypothetical protein
MEAKEKLFLNTFFLVFSFLFMYPLSFSCVNQRTLCPVLYSFYLPANGFVHTESLIEQLPVGQFYGAGKPLHIRLYCRNT